MAVILPSRTLPAKACRWLGRQVLRLTFSFLNPTEATPSPRAPKPPSGRRLAAGPTGAIVGQLRRPITVTDAQEIRHRDDAIGHLSELSSELY
jgi:hypothetical protein